MQKRRVVFRQSAREDLGGIYRYIRAESGFGSVAKAYLRRIRARCGRIGNVPFGGVARDDLGAGIRMTVFERRIVILYRVDDAAVWIINIFSGGRDFDALLAHRRTIAADDPD